MKLPPNAGKYAAILAVAAVCGALFLAPEKSDFRSSALFARDSAAKDTHVEVATRLDRNILYKDDTAQLQVTFQNDNTDALDNLQVSIAAPGFEWTQTDANKLNGTLAANSSVSATIPLRALSRSGTYNILILYSWSKKSRYGSALSLGPLKMVGVLGWDNWSRFLKSLTLPIVLAALGYYIQLKQKTRDERQQVRQNILPLVMTLAESHYMPIVRSAHFLIKHYERDKAIAGATYEETFFDTLFLLKRMDYLRRDKGQIFFQDGAAEKLARDLWLLLREKLRSKFTDAQVELALQKMGNDDSFADFTAKRNLTLLQPAYKGLRTWLNDAPLEFETYLTIVDLIQAIFRCEANRPFEEHWYNRPRQLEFETKQMKDHPENQTFPAPGRGIN